MKCLLGALSLAGWRATALSLCLSPFGPEGGGQKHESGLLGSECRNAFEEVTVDPSRVGLT